MDDSVVTTEWQPMETAPRDGTLIQAKIPGHGTDNLICWMLGFTDAEEHETGCWVFLLDQEPPACWSDGACWASNEDGEPSVQPTEWRRLPDPFVAAPSSSAAASCQEAGLAPSERVQANAQLAQEDPGRFF